MKRHIVDWMRDFVESIGMKILMGPFAKYLDIPGNRGLTVAAIIETSHIVLHSWDELKSCNDTIRCVFLR
jgi:S-adenosylmethionine/arginine decarboxylase-like enzyme